MVDVSKVLNNIIFKEQVAYTVDFNKTRVNTAFIYAMKKSRSD